MATENKLKKVLDSEMSINYIIGMINETLLERKILCQ